MCGLNGFLSAKANLSDTVLHERVCNMAHTLQSRGPDEAGSWVDSNVGIAIAHRRLAVLDLSTAGHQPMTLADGRYVIAFNGEIYNHLEIRSELLASGLTASWRGHSDTETLLAGISAWGLAPTLQRCVGMFAIALWDTQTSTLTLARDRLGEKPLYYGWVGQGAERAFVFGSELKALRAYPGFDAPVSREALAAYLRFNYVPAPLSIYQGIHKLEPGSMLTLPCANSEHGVVIERWWSLTEVVQRARQHPLTSAAEAVEQLEQCLSAAVRQQSLADVPLGAFLSGGVDSSTVVALMQQQSSRPVNTFTIGFDEAGFDEAPYAAAVAQHLGTEHHEMRVSPAMAQEVIQRLPQLYDEPFADSSQIPTHLVCQAARQHVTVALSGDAGDELFGGYNRYFWAPKIWSKVSWLPYPLRQVMAQVLRAVPPMLWQAMERPARIALLASKVGKLAARLASVVDLDDLYWSLVTECEDPSDWLVSDGEYDAGAFRAHVEAQLPVGLDPVERMMFFDTLTYLPDDILCKVDRAAMGCSLETRVPFLDHRVVELAWQMPLACKIRGSMGKWALREVLYTHVPRELIERPKAGFAIPIGQWLRGPLRAWAEALLSSPRLQAEGYFKPEPVRQAWMQHVSGVHDHTTRLWAVLMFQAWLESQSA